MGAAAAFVDAGFFAVFDAGFAFDAGAFEAGAFFALAAAAFTAGCGRNVRPRIEDELTSTVLTAFFSAFALLTFLGFAAGLATAFRFTGAAFAAFGAGAAFLAGAAFGFAATFFTAAFLGLGSSGAF